MDGFIWKPKYQRNFHAVCHMRIFRTLRYKTSKTGEYALVFNSGIFLFQVCSIKIESFAYDKENLLFEWHSPGVEFANVIEIPNLKLEGK